MDKWEYKVLEASTDYKYSCEEEQVLNSWGEQGWELVCCIQAPASLILKRRVIQ